jgi:hypothetical protein
MAKKVSVNAIRRANTKLVYGGDRLSSSLDNSKNGALSIKARYLGRFYELYISPREIRDAYSKSVEKTISK